MKNIRTTSAALLPPLLAAGIACSGETPPTDVPPSIASVAVTPGTASIAVGATRQFVATIRDSMGRTVQRTATWRSVNPGIASVDAAGLVRGIAEGEALVVASVEMRSDTAAVAVTGVAPPPPPPPPPPAGAAIVVDPGNPLQVMKGWEVAAQAGQYECGSFPLYKDAMYDAAVEAGVNRIHIPIRSGVENPQDLFAPVAAGGPWETFNKVAYNAVNDNADPDVINPAGFHFTEMDSTIARVVEPMRQRLAARGEKLYITLTFVDFGKSAYQPRDDPDEYAEFVLAAFDHLKQKWGWVPDALEIVLEPDNGSRWTGGDVGRGLVAAGERLAAAGYHPAYVAPSTAWMSRAITFFDQMVQVPRARDYIGMISYHRYNGVTQAALAGIGNRTVQNSIESGMLEHIGSGYEDLYDDIATGRVSAWRQFSLGFCGTGDKGGALFGVDTSIPASPLVVMGSRTKFLRQYFRFVRMDAQRIRVTSGDVKLAPLAFINTDGGYVVVVKASGAASFHVEALPAGTYGIKYTTTSAYDVDLADVMIASGGSVNAAIPAAGVITIYGKM